LILYMCNMTVKYFPRLFLYLKKWESVMVWRYRRTALSFRKVGELNEWRICRYRFYNTSIPLKQGKLLVFSIETEQTCKYFFIKWLFWVIYKSYSVFVKYLQRIFGANPYTWSVYLRKTGNRKNQCEVFSTASI
jgi:hypothetical protein